MKKTIVVVLAMLLILPALVQAGQMELGLKQVVRHAGLPPGAQGSWSKALTEEEGKTLVPCLIRSRDVHVTAEAIEEADGRAMIVSDEILSAHIPPASVEAIVARPEVVVAESAAPLTPKMDSARASTKVDTVQSGAALGTAYNGTNVVVGVVDGTFDYGHPDFLGTSGATRVQFVQQTVAGVPVQCTKRIISAGTCAITDGGQGDLHGTHVTGTAAGSNATYTGVAPLADVMFYFYDITDGDSSGSLATSVVEGVTTIFGKADTMDKAAVANLSLGTSFGAHDGTSLVEQGLTALSAAKGGRIIVNAAGNEQTVTNAFPVVLQPIAGGIHASINAAAGTGAGWRAGVWSGSTAVARSFTGGTTVDLWLDVGTKDSCTVSAIGYTGGRSTANPLDPTALDAAQKSFSTIDVPFSADTAVPETATGGGVTASIELQSVDARNGKPHAVIVFAPGTGQTSSKLETMWFDIVVRSKDATPCTGHMWLYYDSAYTHDFLKAVAGSAVAAGGGVAAYTLANGDDQYTTTIPATATGVIAIGSYLDPKPAGSTTSVWTGDDGVTYDQTVYNGAVGAFGTPLNDLSLFSSLGPTADGRTKPDIVAPGEPIISTKASRVAEDGALTVGVTHVKMQGTSMASPHAAGIVALLLERNNTLTVEQVRAALRAGADAAGLTSPKTANTENGFGAGRVNAAAVLGSVGADTSLYHGTGDLDPAGGGGGGCSLAAGAGPWAAGGGTMLIGALLAVIALRRRGRGV